MSASYTDAVLALAMRAVEVRKAMEEKAAEIEGAYGSLLEERLEKESEWPKELERRSALLE